MPSYKSAQSTPIRTMRMEDFNDDLLLYAPREIRPQAPAHGCFAVHSRKDYPIKEDVSASRRDYYKISLITKGTGTYTAGERRYEINGPTLIFLHPQEVKTWHATSSEQDGYYCIFTEKLFEPQHHELLQYPLLQLGAQGVFSITEEQSGYLQSIFRQLLKEYKENAAFKQEAILIYLKLLMLESKRIAQAAGPVRSLTAAQLLSHRFTDKLEKQFPIEHTTEQIALKTAKEFANILNTHPNHLNACVKHTTGRTVSEHIRQRLLLEARLLLMHTDWQIAEIAWCLGFEDPGNFTHFFRNHSGQSPYEYRAIVL
ncbi:helix-turn-helix domain-containing protein [Chitinophaga vietnamensis]|uniref:helix-turn-helix domain-containing protein n=1 Tax=Chitinophaga vietnamensis TaxID=2593957 RepID=UPI001177D2E0|nr:helix-turn-helix domain-containing protein [Chitinophaga vietnamensis]